MGRRGEQYMDVKELRKTVRSLDGDLQFLVHLVYVYDDMLKEAFGETLYQAMLRGKKRDIELMMPTMNKNHVKIFKEVVEHFDTGIR